MHDQEDKVKAIRPRTGNLRKVVEVQSEMWHLDSDLIDIDL